MRLHIPYKIMCNDSLLLCISSDRSRYLSILLICCLILVAMGLPKKKKWKKLRIFFFHQWQFTILDVSKNKITLFSCSNLYNYALKMNKKNAILGKCRHSSCHGNQIETQNQTIMCATFQVWIGSLYAIQLMLTYLCLLDILFHKIWHFPILASVLLLWLPWLPDKGTCSPSFFFFFCHNILVYTLNPACCQEICGTEIWHFSNFANVK